MKSIIAICLVTQRKQKHPHFTSLNRNNKRFVNIAINKMYYCSFDFALYSGHRNFELELKEVNEFLAKLEVPSWQNSTRTTEMIMEVLLPHSRPTNSRGSSPASDPRCSLQVRSRSNSRSQRLIQCVFL